MLEPGFKRLILESKGIFEHYNKPSNVMKRIMNPITYTLEELDEKIEKYKRETMINNSYPSFSDNFHWFDDLYNTLEK